MKLQEILSKEVYFASPSHKIYEVAQMMLRHNVGAIPICDKDKKLVGIITDRDIAIECCTSQADAKDSQVGEHMTNNPITASPDLDLIQACELMAREQIRRLPVVDNNGRLVGIVTLGDLAVSMPHEQAVLNALARMSIPSRIPDQTVLKEKGIAA